MGGALAEPTPGAGARAILPGRLCVFALGVPEDEASAALIGSTLAAMDRALEPVTVGAYSNFIEERAQTSFSFDEDTWARLRRAKAL